MYLRGEKEPKADSFFLELFKKIKDGPSKKGPKSETAVDFPRLIRMDIEDDIRIFPEIVETGDSAIVKEELARKHREDMLKVKGPNPSDGPRPDIILIC
jgi:hypothetical protein